MKAYQTIEALSSELSVTENTKEDKKKKEESFKEMSLNILNVAAPTIVGMAFMTLV